MKRIAYILALLLALAACSQDTTAGLEPLDAYDNIVYSKSADLSSPSRLDDATVSDDIYVWFEPDGEIEYVKFYLDGTWVDERTERVAPYALSGDDSGKLKALDTSKLSSGRHEIVASVKKLDGPLEEWRAYFSVNNSSSPNPENESYLDILDELEGFGETTTGGADGEVVTVTNLNNSGAGSLREAVSMTGPKWIMFEEGLQGTINLSSALKVKSNKTIDGRGADITLSGDTLQVTEEDNVIVTHLKFEGAGTDAIRIRNGSSNIWVHQNSLSNAGDGLIDVIFGSKNITISRNHFSSHVKTVLLGLGGVADEANITATLHHNFFDGTGERMPRLRSGKVHSYNNYIAGWNWAPAYVEASGEVYSEANIYEAGGRKRASNYPDENPGYLKLVNDLMENGAFHKTTGASNVFTPSDFYGYQADAANASLKSDVMSNTGWQQTSSFIAGQ